MIKIIVIAIFALIIFNLGSALFHLVRHKSDASSVKTLKALTFRIGLSVFLFAVIAILLLTGVIKPHGIGSKAHPQKSIASESMK
ncbi:MAG: twin transmembrane helix small protein [Methyloglobulus sp.]|nr:twin transmembrane helix small protein [Methyloglobulus sp.]